MWRIIKILKYFQHTDVINIFLLQDKFHVTIRTLQRDITFINKSLKKISNSQILKRTDNFYFNGDNKERVVANLLAQFIHMANDDPFIRIGNLLLSCVWQKKYLPSQVLINNSFTITTKYNLHKDIVSLNNFFIAQNLKLNLQFYRNKGFKLIGHEYHLRFITAKIISQLTNYFDFPISTRDTTLFYMYQVTWNLISSSYKREALAWLLVVAIRRIKLNLSLSNDNLITIPQLPFKAEAEINKLIGTLAYNFNLKLTAFDTNYFTTIILMNTKISSNWFSELILVINSLVDDILHFINKNYQVVVNIKMFKQILVQFFTDNWFSIVFGYEYDCSLFDNDTCDLASNYYWGQQLVNIINTYLQTNTFLRLNLWKNKYLVIALNKVFIINENWKVPLIVLIDDSFINDQISNFIITNFPNISIISLTEKISISLRRYLINPKPKILITDIEDSYVRNYNLSQYTNLAIVSISREVWNYQLLLSINKKIELLMLRQIQQAITVFSFYKQEKFADINNLLWKFQKIFLRRYQLTYEFFTSNNYVIIKTFLSAKILLIQQLIPYPNANFPIILIYLTNPLVFQKKFHVHFIFILFNHKENIDNDRFFKQWLNLFQKVANNKMINSNHIYQLLATVISN